MLEKPIVSVIITTYHNEEYLPRAIESVLTQTYTPLELIVVDDNQPESISRQKTEQIMKDYPQVRYIRHPENRNGAAARNTGISVASGKYVAFLDNDDIYLRTHIEECVNALLEHPEYGAVVSGVLKIRGGLCWELIPAVRGDMVRSLLLSETALGTGSNLFAELDLVKKIQGFDESFKRHQDVEFGIRLFEKCKVYRIHSVQIIKEMDGFSNRPDFKRFLEAKQKLWNKFETVIQQLGEDDCRRYFAGQYSALLYEACNSASAVEQNWCCTMIEKYRPLNKKEKVILLMTQMKLFPVYECLKKCIKRKKSKKIYGQILQQLRFEDMETVKKALSHASMNERDRNAYGAYEAKK